MARIAGINVPDHKHAVIGLTAIYGIGINNPVVTRPLLSVTVSFYNDPFFIASAFSRVLTLYFVCHFIGVLGLPVTVRVKSSNQLEVKNTEIILALVPVVFFLLFTGRIDSGGLMRTC